MLKIQEVNIEYSDDTKAKRLVWELWKEGFTGTVRNGVVSVWDVKCQEHFDFIYQLITDINEAE